MVIDSDGFEASEEGGEVWGLALQGHSDAVLPDSGQAVDSDDALHLRLGRACSI